MKPYRIAKILNKRRNTITFRVVSSNGNVIAECKTEAMTKRIIKGLILEKEFREENRQPVPH
jgi:hypothetical protein